MWASFKKSSIELVTMLLLSYVFSFFFFATRHLGFLAPQPGIEHAQLN